MTYTVTLVPSAEEDLARIWLAATDRPAISQAANEIDRALRDDAPQKGEVSDQGLMQIVIPPLIARFTVSIDDRLATIWSISHIGTVTNGH